MQAARGASLSPSEPNPQSPSPDDLKQARSRRNRCLALFWTLAVVLIALDQWVKELAIAKLTGEGRVELVGDWFGLQLVRNPGAAFSMGTSFTELLAVVAAIATIVVVWLSFKVRSTFWAVGLSFLLAGVVGNLIDRLTREPGFGRGHVIDMFAFPNFPIFNVADICINVAAGVIIVQAVRGIRLDGTREENDD
ncbi:signal peptidase II [Nocardioides sp. Bht2]|uniref:signal peptidase II n=1 Tax=Nocardioides sp. Bht2 TaxID=3392297 RepID=UPI0039B5A020